MEKKLRRNVRRYSPGVALAALGLRRTYRVGLWVDANGFSVEALLKKVGASVVSIGVSSERSKLRFFVIERRHVGPVLDHRRSFDSKNVERLSSRDRLTVL